MGVGVQAHTGVTLAGAGHLVNQIYASALPVAYADAPIAAWEPFARLVLEAAYEATFRVSVAQQAAGGSGRLFLTRLGGGAFGNPDAWVNDAILRAAARVGGEGLDVFLLSYGSSHPATRAVIAAWEAGV